MRAGIGRKIVPSGRDARVVPSNQWEATMFERVVSKVSSIVRNTVRAIGAATNRTPWLGTAAILALFLLL